MVKVVHLQFYKMLNAECVNRKKRSDTDQQVAETDSVQNSRQVAAVAHYQRENDYDMDHVSPYQQIDLSSAVSDDKHVYKQLNKTARR